MSAVAAGAAAGAVLLVLARPGHRSSPAPPAPRTDELDHGLLRRLRVPLTALAAAGGWTVLGGLAGLVVGALAAGICWRVLGNVVSPAVVRRRETLERELPVAVHLLGAALAAGASPSSAVLAVADALPGPVADEFRRTHHRLVLGLDPAAVWRSVPEELRPLGRTLARAHESGGSVRAAVESLSEDLRHAARARSEALARTVEVRASAPLGLCFLPAFVLLGIVPMAVGIFSSIRLFG